VRVRRSMFVLKCACILILELEIEWRDREAVVRMDVRTNSEEPPTSPAGDEAGGDEHADVLDAAEEGAADEAEDGAVNYAGFAALGVHDIGGEENP
jgi:hypothetical protein